MVTWLQHFTYVHKKKITYFAKSTLSNFRYVCTIKAMLKRNIIRGNYAKVHNSKKTSTCCFHNIVYVPIEVDKTHHSKESDWCKVRRVES